MARRTISIIPAAFDKFPEINGELFLWHFGNDNSKYILGTGSSVASLIPKEGTYLSAGSLSYLTQSNGSLQGTKVLNAINGKMVLGNFKTYTVGDTTTFKFMHDRSIAYAIFSVANYSAIGTGLLYYTIFGGLNNGIQLSITTGGAVGKLIRQSDGAGYTELVSTVSANGVVAINAYQLISDVFYGYQVTGNDVEISVNNGSPVLTANCATSTWASANTPTAFTIGTGSGNTSLASLMVVKFTGLTRTEIDDDIATIKTFINSLYHLW